MAEMNFGGTTETVVTNKEFTLEKASCRRRLGSWQDFVPH